MTTHLGLQRILLPSAQVSQLTTGSITLPSARTAFVSNSYESIATVSVGSGGQSTMTFSSIPSTYTHLQLRGLVRNSSASAGSLDMYMRFNGDSGASKYTAYHQFFGYDTSSKGAAASFNQSSIAAAYILRNGNSASYFTSVIIDIFDYRNTNKFKSTKTFFCTQKYKNKFWTLDPKRARHLLHTNTVG